MALFRNDIKFFKKFLDPDGDPDQHEIKSSVSCVIVTISWKIHQNISITF